MGRLREIIFRDGESWGNLGNRASGAAIGGNALETCSCVFAGQVSIANLPNFETSSPCYYTVHIANYQVG
jgi:hypothetical protein